MTVTTWADGHGIWHASVYEHAYARPRDAARRAIRRELAARESPQYDPSRTGVRLREIRNGQMIYDEVVR